MGDLKMLVVSDLIGYFVSETITHPKNIMFKLASLALLALVCSVPLAAAASPSKTVFKGQYNGVATLETVTGESIFYSPLRFNISKTGSITGTAYNDTTKVLSKVTGTVNKVTVRYGNLYIGRAAGKFSNGTKWTAEITALKGQTGKTISGKARQGAYSGSISMTNL